MLSAEFTPPRWAQELPRYLGVKPQYVLWGNIHDIYPIQLSGNLTTLPLAPYLKELLQAEGYDLVLRFEPLFGFSLLAGDAESFKKISGIAIDSREQKEATLLRTAEILEKIETQRNFSVATLFSFGSRLMEASTQQERNEFFYRIYRLGITSVPFLPQGKNGSPMHNIIIWLLDRENDLPPWYGVNNPMLRNMPISRPDHAIRRNVVEMCAKNLPGYNELSTERQKEKKSLFLDQTGGLFASEIIAISQIAVREKISFSQIAEAIRRYKLGIIENPWAKISRETFANAENNLQSRVMGQPHAVRHSVDVLKRSLFNLSGSQFSPLSQKPKGVLFLAGPTGVGKTELAKSITEMIFGTPTNYLRFDMSEFGHEHADQRMLGAPPGYVGYDAGGELTNAVREKPFSLILFDEIEKGHPKILDIFLQILDDGRLTSGRGETVYFSESLIVFTSNLGMSEDDDLGGQHQAVNPDMPYVDIQKKIMASIENHFKYRLNRPEILNRIGRNIIVFDFIRPNVAEKIFAKMLSNVYARLAEDHKIELTLAPAVQESLVRLCCADLSMGGRGIGNALEEYFVNPLSRELFSLDASEGRYTVREYEHTAGETRMLISRE